VQPPRLVGKHRRDEPTTFGLYGGGHGVNSHPGALCGANSNSRRGPESETSDCNASASHMSRGVRSEAEVHRSSEPALVLPARCDSDTGCNTPGRLSTCARDHAGPKGQVWARARSSVSITNSPHTSSAVLHKDGAAEAFSGKINNSPQTRSKAILNFQKGLLALDESTCERCTRSRLLDREKQRSAARLPLAAALFLLPMSFVLKRSHASCNDARG